MTLTFWYALKDSLGTDHSLTSSVSRTEYYPLAWTLSFNVPDVEGQDGWGVLDVAWSRAAVHVAVWYQDIALVCGDSVALHPQVEAPIDKVYKIWSNRLNYSEWFDLIGQVNPACPVQVGPSQALHSETSAGCSMLAHCQPADTLHP